MTLTRVYFSGYLLNQNIPELNDKLVGLLKALAGIMVVFFIIFMFAYLLPVFLRIMYEKEIKSVGETFIEVTAVMGTVLGGLAWLFFGLLAIIFVVCFAVFLPVIIKISKKHISKGDEALKTLKIRYAKGELTKEQYLDMKKTLEDL